MWNKSIGKRDVVLTPFRQICDLSKDLDVHVSKPSSMFVRCQVIIEKCMRSLSNFYIDSWEAVDYTNLEMESENASNKREETRNSATISMFDNIIL